MQDMRKKRDLNSAVRSRLLQAIAPSVLARVTPRGLGLPCGELWFGTMITWLSYVAPHGIISLPFADPRNLLGWRSHSWSLAPALCSPLSGAAESRLPPPQGTLTLNFKFRLALKRNRGQGPIRVQLMPNNYHFKLIPTCQG